MLFLKKKSFNEFLESPEGIATNILTERLKRLEESGIILKRPYQKTPLRNEYILTRRGEELRTLLIEMIRWGNVHIEGTIVPPKEFLNTFGFMPIRTLLLLVSLVSMIAGGVQIMMPVFARDIFHGGATMLGLLMGSSGLGALIGAMYLASRKNFWV